MNKDQYYMAITNLVSTRSSCLTRQVGAILIKNDHIISTGYNGTPRGMTNCNENGCLRCKNHIDLENDMQKLFSDFDVKSYEKYSGKDLDICVCLHAEENAIIQCAKEGISIKDSGLYTTYFPCLNCVKLIINSEIDSIVWQQPYGDIVLPTRLLQQASISIFHYEGEKDGISR